MAEFYALKNKLATDEDIKSINDKVDVNTPLYRTFRSDNTINKYSDLFPDGSFDHTLQALQLNTNNKGIINGNATSAIVFGGENTRAMLEVHWASHFARIFGFHTDAEDGWHEDVAWKSDIQRLENEISELKKQIGGGKALR